MATSNIALRYTRTVTYRHYRSKLVHVYKNNSIFNEDYLSGLARPYTATVPERTVGSVSYAEGLK